MALIMSIIPDSHADILDSMAMWHVATVGPGGEPQSSPVWIGWDGTHLRFSTRTTRQKYRNLATRPEVEADCYIDDAAHNIEGLRAAGNTVIIFDQPYNRHLPAPRATNWVEVEQIVHQLAADWGQHVQPQIPGIDAGADRLQRRQSS